MVIYDKVREDIDLTLFTHIINFFGVHVEGSLRISLSISLLKWNKISDDQMTRHFETKYRE